MAVTNLTPDTDNPLTEVDIADMIGTLRQTANMLVVVAANLHRSSAEDDDTLDVLANQTMRLGKDVAYELAYLERSI